jgi:outer membrane biosynthesis protein TonB
MHRKGMLGWLLAAACSASLGVAPAASARPSASTGAPGPVEPAAASAEGFDPAPDATAIASAVRRRTREIKACYERALAGNPSLHGKVVLRFAVQPDGSASDISVATDTLRDPVVVRCIEQVLARVRVSKPPRTPVWVEFPFVFAPAPEARPVPPG